MSTFYEHGALVVSYDVAPEEGTADAVMSKALAEKAAQAIAAAKPVPVVVAEPPTMRRLLDMGKPVRVVAFVERQRDGDDIARHLQDVEPRAQGGRSGRLMFPSGAVVHFQRRDGYSHRSLRADVIVGFPPSSDDLHYLFDSNGPRIYVVGEAAERAFWGMERRSADGVWARTDLQEIVQRAARRVFSEQGLHVGVDHATGPDKAAFVLAGRGAGKSGMVAAHASDVVDAAWFATNPSTIGHSVRLPRPGAFAVAIGKFFAGITRWAATPEGQRAIRDLHVRRACEDVPPGCDARRWRNVVHVIAADAVERNRDEPDVGKRIRGSATSAAAAVAHYGRLRFCFRYPERDAVKETLAAMGCDRCRWTERMLRAYEVGS